MRTLVAVQMGRVGAYKLNISALWGQSRFLQLFIMAYISIVSCKSALNIVRGSNRKEKRQMH